MEAAIQEVRKSMGPDAIIISTYESPRGRGVEVRAAVEDFNIPGRAPEGPNDDTLPIDDDLERRLRRELLGEMKSQISALSEDVVESRPLPAGARQDTSQPDRLEYEVRPDGWVKTGISGLLKTPLGKSLPTLSRPSPADENAETQDIHTLLDERSWVDEDLEAPLAFHNVPGPLRANLIRAAAAMDAEDATLALGAALDARIAMDPVSASPARPIAIVGAPGAGKTVTVAKLAAKSVLAGNKVCLVTTDSLRAGAVAQLEAFAEIMKIKLHTAETVEALQQITADHPGHTVFIDTPATNPYSRGELGDLDDFIKSCNLEPVLVAPASGNADDFVDLATIFASLGVRRLIVTRIDTTRRLGGILAAVDAANLALAQVSITPYVAQGLSTINPLSLARLLVEVPTAKARVTPDLKPRRGNKTRKAIR
jgi:flagellar biosynthesis protein FlhF